MSIRKLFLGGLVFWLGLHGSQAADSAHPQQEIQKVADQVLSLLADANMDQMARREKIRALIEPHFDYKAMGQRILALNWKKATPQQQQRFVALFKEILFNTYIAAMESYAGEKIRYGRERVEGKRATVDTFIVRPNGVETPVTYRLRRKQDEWVAYDVLAEGVSMVSNYRNSFRSIVERDGMDALLQDMQAKVSAQG